MKNAKASSGAGENVSRVFMGWEVPPVVGVADFVCRTPDRLRNQLVVVPTREGGRRLRELLAERAVSNGTGAVLGPRVATPDDFFRPDALIPETARYAGWVRVLSEAGDESVANIFPKGIQGHEEGWYLSLARQIEQARDTLAAANFTFQTVQGALAEEKERWAELARLEAQVREVWEKWGYEDPVQAKVAKARSGKGPAAGYAGVSEIVVACVPDPTWLAVQAWETAAAQGVKVTVLICAPEELAAHFDAWGRPDPGYWTNRAKCRTPEPGRTYVAADASGLAELVAQSCKGKESNQTGIGVCADVFIPAVMRRLEAAGWASYDPQGEAMATDGWPELLRRLIDAIEDPGSYQALASLARHPFVYGQWLKDCGPKSALAALDRWEAEICPCASKTALEQLATKSGPALGACLKLLVETAKFLKRSGKDGALAGQLISWAGEDRALRELVEKETASWEHLESYKTVTRLRLLASATGTSTIHTAHDRDAIPLAGWLELLFEPAPHLIIAALHEGVVPENPGASPLITEVLREQLQFRDRASRLAREVFLYSAMVHSRAKEGSTTVITAQMDPTGEPCKPSRVLLQAPPTELPARVAQLMKEDADIQGRPTPAWGRGEWRLAPEPGTLPNCLWDHFSPSTLHSYLSCPTRFYFERVLGWELVAPFEEELAPNQFGSFMHLVLKEWGAVKRNSTLTNPQVIAKEWVGALDDLVGLRFGKELPPVLRLQMMSARERLEALAHVQAGLASEGWRIIKTEETYTSLSLEGRPVKTKIDRIDQNEGTGAVRVIDYKTSKSGSKPEKTHLATHKPEVDAPPLGPLVQRGRSLCRWKDLQLPLYVLAVQKELKLPEPPEACYIVIPDAVSETGVLVFDHLNEHLDCAWQWAQEAARRIVNGVFWPPCPETAYDNFSAIAPEGLKRALGPRWEELLKGLQTPGRRAGKAEQEGVGV